MKLVRESLIEDSLNERFATLSDILSKINLDSFKSFIKDQQYNIAQLGDIVLAMINWGKSHNKDFEQYEQRDLEKVAEYMQDLVFSHPIT